MLRNRITELEDNGYLCKQWNEMVAQPLFQHPDFARVRYEEARESTPNGPGASTLALFTLALVDAVAQNAVALPLQDKHGWSDVRTSFFHAAHDSFDDAGQLARGLFNGQLLSKLARLSAACLKAALHKPIAPLSESEEKACHASQAQNRLRLDALRTRIREIADYIHTPIEKQPEKEKKQGGEVHLSPWI